MGKNVFEALEWHKRQRIHWDQLWRDIGVYVHSLTTNFSVETFDDFDLGKPLNTKVFDTHAVKANRIAAASIKGELWPRGGQSIKLIPSKYVQSNSENRTYFDDINNVGQEILDEPEAGLDVALDEYFVDQTGFGNGGVGMFRDPNTIFRFEFWPIQYNYIGENKRGYIDEVYQLRHLEVHKIVDEYGLDKVSGTIREKFFQAKGRKEKFWVLRVIRPRAGRNPLKSDNRNMAYESLHYELKNKHLLRVGGFKEFPVKFARFMKRGREVYGRGAGGDALPEIKELNFTREALILGIEKTVEPPLLLENDSLLGNVVETGPNAVNVVESDARSSEQPIRPLFIVGDLSVAANNIELLKTSIDEHFFLDKLLDFNNDTRMTLGEVKLRDNLRGRSLSSIYTRQIMETFHPLITMFVNQMLDIGLFGVSNEQAAARVVSRFGREPIIMPQQIQKLISENKPFYQIRYDTPAARTLNSSLMEGIIETGRVAAELGQTDPAASFAYNNEEALRWIAEMNGVERIIHDKETVKKRVEEEQRAREVETERLQAEAERNRAQAQQVNQQTAG